MHRFFLSLFLTMMLVSYGQIDKIGYSKTSILNSYNSPPCKKDINAIWYCMENGHLINYTFTDNKVSSVLYMWEFDSKLDADEDVEKEKSKYSAIYGKPTMKGGQAFWFVGDNLLIMCSYAYTNGKHYSTWRVSTH